MRRFGIVFVFGGQHQIRLEQIVIFAQIFFLLRIQFSGISNRRTGSKLAQISLHFFNRRFFEALLNDAEIDWQKAFFINSISRIKSEAHKNRRSVAVIIVEFRHQLAQIFGGI